MFYCNRKSGSKSLISVIKMNFYVRFFKPDILHIHGRGLVKNFFWKGKKVQTLHNSGYKKNEHKSFDKLYAISDSVKNEWYPVVGDKVVTVANGIVVDNIAKKNLKCSIPAELHFVQVARLLTFQKGLDLLLLALRMLLDKHPDVNVKLHLIGNGPDESILQKIVVFLDLEKNVVFEGLRDRNWIYENLQQFDLFIQPSRFEGFGLTVAEACAAKLPVLVCDCEGPLEILDGGKLGMTFKTASRCENIFDGVVSEEELKKVLRGVQDTDKASIEDLSDKMKDFIAAKYPYEMIERAYVRVKEKYDIKQTVNQYVEEYRAFF